MIQITELKIWIWIKLQKKYFEMRMLWALAVERQHFRQPMNAAVPVRWGGAAATDGLYSVPGLSQGCSRTSLHSITSDKFYPEGQPGLSTRFVLFSRRGCREDTCETFHRQTCLILCNWRNKPTREETSSESYASGSGRTRCALINSSSGFIFPFHVFWRTFMTNSLMV